MAFLPCKLLIPFPKLRVRYDNFHSSLFRFHHILLAQIAPVSPSTIASLSDFAFPLSSFIIP
jgi:hypothetical protein